MVTMSLNFKEVYAWKGVGENLNERQWLKGRLKTNQEEKLENEEKNSQ